MLIRRIALGLAALALALFILEGVASVAVFLWHVRMNIWLPLPERAYTDYDPELGWISGTNRHVSNLYGSGRSLTTNSRGFRNARDFDDKVPVGMTRIVAIGDSFTLGFGVDDADSWPARLEHECAHIEVPNLGQGGYGIDQSQLHYARTAAALDHTIVIGAFIVDDFSRTRAPQMALYGKPLFRIRDGAPHLENVPVPRAPYLAPWLTQNLRLLEKLRSVELGRLLIGVPPVFTPTPEDEATRVIAFLLEAFARTAHDHGATPVFVLLPSMGGGVAGGDPKEFALMPGYARAALQQGTDPPLVRFDLHDEFASVPAAERPSLFLSGPRVRGAGAHYSPAGNALVARAIARRLEAAGLLPPAACAPDIAHRP